MIKQKSLIGSELDSSIKTIELAQIRNLAASKGEASFSDKHINNQAGLVNKFLTLPLCFYGNFINQSNIIKNLNLNIKNILLSRESIIAHRELKVGERLKIRSFLADIYEQQASSNPIGFVVLESIGALENNQEIIFYCERVLAVRGGFSRGR